MPWIAYALPVVPGQSQRLEQFSDELATHLDAYLELNEQATVKRHYEWLQKGPTGDLRITVFEMDDPQKLDRDFTDSAYDDWWLQHNREVHGFDPAEMETNFPVMIHSYEAD